MLKQTGLPKRTEVPKPNLTIICVSLRFLSARFVKFSRFGQKDLTNRGERKRKLTQIIVRESLALAPPFAWAVLSASAMPPYECMCMWYIAV